MSNEKNTAAYDPRYFNADGTPVSAETNVEFVNRIMAEQAKIDATDDAMADDIVEMQAPTLSTPHASGSPVAAFVQFAKSWIKTAARYARNADFWRAKAEEATETVRRRITADVEDVDTVMKRLGEPKIEEVRALWQLLDDIDTEDDFCKDMDAVFRVRVRAIQKKRWAIWTPDEGRVELQHTEGQDSVALVDDHTNDARKLTPEEIREATFLEAFAPKSLEKNEDIVPAPFAPFVRRNTVDVWPTCESDALSLEELATKFERTVHPDMTSTRGLTAMAEVINMGVAMVREIRQLAQAVRSPAIPGPKEDNFEAAPKGGFGKDIDE